jgi:hypothetical protein
MTQKTKLIVGAVVVLGAYYLYDRNKKMKAVSDLKAGAETPSPALGGGDRTTLEPMTSVPLATELRADSIQVAQGGNKFSSFTGKRGNSFFETIF